MSMRFPLPYVPTQSYRGGRGFGASREKVREGLRHGAVDLIAPPNAPVLAIDDGVVIRGPSPFFRGTFALEVQHTMFIARYCEIAQKTEVKAGDRVKAGQVIAYVGDQPGHDMLHLELFSGKAAGPLTQTGKPYDRREDLIDPTLYLDGCINTVANVKGEKYEFWTDGEGRKFLLADKKFLIDL